MNLKTQYPVSKALADCGVDVAIGDATFKLAYYNSSTAQMFFHAELQKFSKDNNPDVAVILAMRSTLVNKVVLGWDNLKEDETTVIYSKEECERILTTYEGLDISIMSKSMEINLYKEKVAKETLEK